MKPKKFTLASFKAFINKNRDKLVLKNKSSFDGMVDCVMPVNDEFSKIIETTHNLTHALGITGLWLVGGSRDRFEVYTDELYTGYEVWNCCGSSIVCIPKN